MPRDRSLADRVRTWIPFGAVPELAPDALHEALERDDAPVVLDVRSEAEFRLGHIRAARHMPLVGFEAALDDLALDPARAVVVICLSAHRSVAPVRILRERGFSRAAQLRGGMIAWWRQGLPTTRHEG